MTDFIQGKDKIDLSDETIFKGLTADNFNERVSIVDYSGHNTVVKYDADGNGATQAVDILHLNTGLILNIDDFIL